MVAPASSTGVGIRRDDALNSQLSLSASTRDKNIHTLQAIATTATTANFMLEVYESFGRAGS